MNKTFRKMFHTTSPYGDFPVEDYKLDLHGFCEDVRHLREIIAIVKPRTIAEVGVWKGSSAFCIVEESLKYHDDVELLAVDTWLGSADFWYDLTDPRRNGDLRLKHGYPGIYYQFLANVLIKEMQDYITPLPLSSLAAAQLALVRELRFDLVHIDAGHEYPSIFADISEWRHVSPVLCGHDFDAESVERAVVDSFGGRVKTFGVWWFALSKDYRK